MGISVKVYKVIISWFWQICSSYCTASTITPSVNLLPLQSSINAEIFPSAYKWRRASEHQEEVKSAETEFIEGQREHERSEPCRMKHTEEPKQVGVYSWFFINETKTIKNIKLQVVVIIQKEMIYIYNIDIYLSVYVYSCAKYSWSSKL